MGTANTLIRLGECPGWSVSSLGVHSFCWFFHVVAHICFSDYSLWKRAWSDDSSFFIIIFLSSVYLGINQKITLQALTAAVKALHYILIYWINISLKSLSPKLVLKATKLALSVCVFGFNVAFNNFSVISRRCLVASGSSVLTFIVLPHWSIMPQTLDMIPHPVTLSWHWVDQS